ncbi:MAG: hypothetical protein ABIS50_06980 [Luteolibacter sp.]|uniref:hypothetical protein n=1 Tax=Luteolibacter sp. TaxID=1962973 RepID=UPI0032670E6E
MFNPTRDTKTPLSSRIALSGALLLAGIFGLGAAIILPVKKFKNPDVVQAHPIMDNEIIPAKQAKPAGLAIPETSSENLVRFCSGNVTESRSFVVFKMGTAVIVDEPCEDPLAVARKKLAACSEPDVRFVTEPTREGDLIVSFKEPVFHRFSGDELANLTPWLESTARALLTPEESVSVSEGWTPNRNARFGLLARRKMLEDAANPIPVRIIRAKSRAVAAN